MNARTSVLLIVCAFVGFNVFAAEPAATAVEAPKSAAARTGAQEAASSSATTNAARADRLELDTTVVTGNRELPKVLYIVPWKKAELGELPAQPFNTLLDEVLTPIDRDVFRREVTYYDAVSNRPNTAASPADAPAVRPEK